ncbi:hypothetical protein [Pontixanthobacter luteolus]|nr:hypothetical protein [Pontixanthobacter luteolus]
MNNNGNRSDPQPDKGKGPPEGKGRPDDRGRPVPKHGSSTSPMVI